MVFALALSYVLDRRIVTASVFSLVPDFDILFKFLYPFVHRGMMHSLLAALTATGLVYLYSRDRVSAESCLLGYLVAGLGLDLLTFSGVPLFFPFHRDLALSLVSAYSIPANSAIVSLSVGAMYVKKNRDIFRPFLDLN